MTGGANNTFITNGNLTINAGTGSVASVTLGATSSVRAGGSGFLGTAGKTGRDLISVGTQSTVAFGQNLVAVGASGGVINTTLISFGSAAANSQGNLIVGGSASFNAGTVTNSSCGATIFGSGTVSIGSDLFLFGGSATGANAFIQSSPNAGQATALFTVNVGRDIAVQGGTSAAGTAQAFILTTRGSQQVSAGRDISIVGGTGSANNSGIIGGGFTVSGVVADTATSTVNALRHITLTNRAARAFVDTFQAGRNTSNTGSVSVNAGGNLTLSTGITTSEVALTALDNHPIYVEADHPFAAGDLWAANGDPFLSSTILAAASSQQNANGVGGFSVDTGLTGGGISLTSLDGPITLKSADHFFNNSICNLTIGPAATLNNLTITSTSGDIAVDPFHNIQVTNGVTTAGSVLMIAQNDIQFTATGLVTAGTTATFVVDNQAPRSPLIGPGAFLMAVGSTIDSGGRLSIYTARQSQNSILGLLNGNLFSPGDLFTDTALEVWCTYYPTPLAGTPFTISYKECLGMLTAQAMLVVTEVLYDLHGPDQFPGWSEEFQFDGEPYFISRRLSKILNHPKSYTHLDFAP
jgi:hypothetical protein